MSWYFVSRVLQHPVSNIIPMRKGMIAFTAMVAMVAVDVG